ncbi:hypothetical protein [Actinacidiphila sp. bgisy160]|uniref:hypothetical protein n=1 Tax=Actinacidiphila sp. bgisy160 TaxID=3413796 RepID=UPI003D72AF6A
MAFELDLPLVADPEPDAEADRLSRALTEVGNERFLRAVVRDPARIRHSVVRTTDGDWYLGDLIGDDGEIQCWQNAGPDLSDALRIL